MYLNNQEVATVMTATTTDLGTASQECEAIKDSEKVCNTRADPPMRPMWTLGTQKGNMLGTTVVRCEHGEPQDRDMASYQGRSTEGSPRYLGGPGKGFKHLDGPNRGLLHQNGPKGGLKHPGGHQDGP